MQSQQLQNVIDIMNTVVSALENQQETLDRISQATTATNPTEMTSTDTNAPTSVQFPIQDCSELATDGRYPSGVYTITPTKGMSFCVYCDMDTDNGGWTVFQKRFDGSVRFSREWDEYAFGFGDLNGEYWLGLRKVHELTSRGTWVLRVDLEDFDGETVYALYDSFQVESAHNYFRLKIGSYSGTAGDSLSFNYNRPFSTSDKDNDDSSGNCAATNYAGGWWYDGKTRCTRATLNGQYAETGQSWTFMHWYDWKNSMQGLKKSEMKIKRVQ